MAKLFTTGQMYLVRRGKVIRTGDLPKVTLSTSAGMMSTGAVKDEEAKIRIGNSSLFHSLDRESPR